MTSCASLFADGPCPCDSSRTFEIVISNGFVVEVRFCEDCAVDFLAEDGPIQVREAA